MAHGGRGGEGVFEGLAQTPGQEFEQIKSRVAQTGNTATHKPEQFKCSTGGAS